MTTAGEAALKLLTREVGYTEQPPGSNRTKFGAYWSVDGVAWCAMTVAWAYREAGWQLPDVQGARGFWAYVPYGYKWAKTHGQLVTDPQPGDIVLYGSMADGEPGDHTGLFEQWIVKGQTFWAVEGNTSNADAVGSQTDGIYVARRRRNVSWVIGFWRPTTVPSGTTQLEPQRNDTEDDLMPDYLIQLSDKATICAVYPNGNARPLGGGEYKHLSTKNLPVVLSADRGEDERLAQFAFPKGTA